MKPLTPAEVGQIAEDLIVTFMGHAASPAVLAIDPEMGAKVLTMLHSKVALAMREIHSPEFAANNLAAMYAVMVDSMQPVAPTIIHPQPRTAQ